MTHETESLVEEIIRWDDTTATDGPCDATWDSLAEYLTERGWTRQSSARAAKSEAWREYADALAAVPDYAPTEYDKGRVDQRHAIVEELHVRATEHEKED